jgi:amino acid adenylation domain-containing protein
MDIGAILRQRAEQSRGKTAYTFMNGELEQCIGYDALHARARRISLRLRGLTEPGDRVVLLYPPGLDFIAGLFGCFYSESIAVPAYPPSMGRSGRNLARLRAILADAQPKVALCSTAVLSIAEPLFQTVPELKSLNWVNTDKADYHELAANELPPIREDALAFLQYTSGSTSLPKGVMVTHRNLMHNLKVICDTFEHSSESRGVIWLPPYHDMGLIGGILQPLYAGFPVVLMMPTAFLQRPYAWLKAISDYRATTSGGPNSAYDLCVRRITDEQKSSLDLSCWRVAFSGAETVRLETIDAFTNAFDRCGFRREAFVPCYGLAEATLMVTGFRERPNPVESLNCSKRGLEERKIRVGGSEEGQTLVACGTAEPATQVRIVNPETRTLSTPEEVGEIWVAGPSVAAGYWGKPDLTEEVFRAVIANDGSSGPYLRTGDLGFIANGRVHVTGRLKDLIIIRGLNYYPQDIELTAAGSHPALHGGIGAAFSVDIDGEERLVIAHEVNRYFRAELTEAVVDAVRLSIAKAHELALHAVVIVKPGRIPKTSSGKVQRHICRESFLTNQLAGAIVDTASIAAKISEAWEAESSSSLLLSNRAEEIERHLRKLIKGILRIQTLPSSSEFDLCHAGLDSLMLVDFQQRINEDFGVDLPYSSLFEVKSLAQLASEISEHVKSGSEQTPKCHSSAQSPQPLSHNQKALWFLHELEPDDPAYNIAVAANIQGELNRDALLGAFSDLCRRHEALHTLYGECNGEPFRIVSPETKPLLVSEDASDRDPQVLESRITAAARARFDLRTECPMKVFLFNRSQRDHVLVWVTHHIGADFSSFRILFSELEAFYRARVSGERLNLPPARTCYADYVFWQTSLLEGAEGARLRDFWRNRIKTMSLLRLPGGQRSDERTKRGGATHRRKLDSDLTGRLRTEASRAGLTLNEFCLAAFQVLLHRYTGQENIVLGIPASGRSNTRFKSLVGYCVSPVLIDTEMSNDMSFSAMCHQTMNRVRKAIDHQNFPLALIFEQNSHRRDNLVSTGIQIMFAFHKAERLGKAGPFLLGDTTKTVHWGDLALQPQPVLSDATQFEIMLTVVDSEGDLYTLWQYRTDLFEANVIERMAAHWERLLEEIVRRPDIKLSQYEYLSPDEKRQITFEWNDTAVDYPSYSCLHELFEEQAVRTPDAVAVMYESSHLTYRELNEKANQLAHHLRRSGVAPDVVVPICMERSLELLVGLLGVLKAGGAYLPLEPSDPVERLAAILAETKVTVILTQERFAETCAGAQKRVLNLDRLGLGRESTRNPKSDSRPDNLAYVIYTSGSTGTPKGAMNTHRGICNRLRWMQEAYGLNAADRVLQKTPYTFDVSVWEFFWPLLTGARLVMAKPGGQRDSAYLADLVQQEGITTMHFVPSMLQVFLEEAKARKCSTLRQVICSGEALPFELARRFYDRSNAELYNLYGPTEASVDVTFWKCPRESRSKVVPIGRPIANMRVYILDSRFNLVPVGVDGEIYLGGVGLGRGYWGRADLTAERFVPSPFGEGERLYRTGDVGRYLQDGSVEWVGRTDYQVKIRGNRIELGEIENQLNAHEHIRECVVVAREDGTGSKRLVAYAVLKPGNTASWPQLRDYLGSKLPGYMVPSAFVPIQEFPLTRSGKVDRNRLPAPEGNETRETEYAASRTPTEEVLVRIWEETLKQKQIGIHDNFFHIGGHSLLIAKIASRVRDEFGVEMPMMKFFQGPTIAHLAETIIRQAAERNSADDINALLDELESLSTSEVEERLRKLSAKESTSETRVISSPRNSERR